jgi:hypothetical protein
MYDLLRCLAEWIDPTFPCRNPRPLVIAAPSGDIQDLAEDQSGSDCTDPNDRSDFTVNLIGTPPIGLSIIRNDGAEPEKLLFRENDANIQWTTVQVDRPNLVARIGEVAERPQGGAISLWLDPRHPGDLITVTTTPSMTAEAVNRALLGAIQMRGFTARRSGGFFVVGASGAFTDAGIRYVSFRSTDAGIRKSDLQLIPPSLLDIYRTAGAPTGR